jgi:Pyruvate/2-oxoacid:ferredoxin oxidoreductase delta subunit
VQGPLLWSVFLIFLVGMAIRLVFFLSAITRSGRNRHPKWAYLLGSVGRSFLPFHKAIVNKPLYTTLGYLFHICLIIVPIWLGGHIVLWEESRFGWHWTPIPDSLADWMTLLFLAIASYLLIRRVVVPEIRHHSSKSDYFLLLITALPFLTGYFLTHGSLDSIPFLGDNMGTIHVLSGEMMLIVVLFLFYRTELNAEKCTGCASCEIICPTSTLRSSDEERYRIFSYRHYQCICCGACVGVCPDEAATLRHEIGFSRFSQVFSRQQIGSVQLSECKKCGTLFAPEPQLEKIRRKITDEFIHLCSRCKVNDYVDTLRPPMPWTRSRRVRKPPRKKVV